MSLPSFASRRWTLVRGFVAVGRRMSITLAAQDLCLTQSAVSRQVHALEEQLGVKLLVRGYRSIAFTAEGERLFRSADGALQQLQDVMGEVHARDVRRPVMLSGHHRLHRPVAAAAPEPAAEEASRHRPACLGQRPGRRPPPG